VRRSLPRVIANTSAQAGSRLEARAQAFARQTRISPSEGVYRCALCELRMASPLIYVCTAPRLARLAGRFAGRMHILFVTATLAVTESLPTRWQPMFTVGVSDGRGGESAFRVSGLTELEVLGEVFPRHLWDVAVAPAPRTIIDAGSHIGATVQAFAMRYPQARVIGLEPHPDVYRRAGDNTRALTHAEVLNVALDGQDGVLTLNIRRDSWATSVFGAEASRGSVEVQAVSLQHLIDNLKIDHVDLLKLNIGGSEYAVLSSFRAWERIGTILLEWHYNLHGQPIDELTRLLPRHSYTAVASGAPGC
jgi:FkbM family methyltransferase